MADPSTQPRRRDAPEAPPVARSATVGDGFSPWRKFAPALTVHHLRPFISDRPAAREADPLTGFVQLGIARLNEAMIVALAMTKERNLNGPAVSGSQAN